MCDGGVAAAVLLVQSQQETLPILSQRIEIDQAKRELHRFLAIAADIMAGSANLEYARGFRFEPSSLGPYPLVERLRFEAEFSKKSTSIQPGGLLEARNLGGIGECAELEGVDGEALLPYPDPFAADVQQVRRYCRQFGAHRTKGLAKIVACMQVGTIPPQESGELLPARAAVRMHRKKREQRTAFLGRNRNSYGRFRVGAGDEPTKKMKVNARRPLQCRDSRMGKE